MLDEFILFQHIGSVFPSTFRFQGKDMEAGDIKGQKVNNIWFVVNEN